MTLRQATRDDLDSIVDIACRSRALIYADFIEPEFWMTKRDELRGVYAGMLADPPSVERCLFSVVENDQGRVAGYSIAGFISERFRHEFPLYWIREIFLSPDQAGKGQGVALMAAMAEHFTAMDPGPVGLAVGKGNEKAIQFYERLGAKIYGTSDENMIYGRNIPSITMIWDDAADLLKSASERMRDRHTSVAACQKRKDDGPHKIR